MLTPESLSAFSSEYLGKVDALNEQIVRDIVRRMIKTGKVTTTAQWQIRKAQESGKLLDDIVKDVGIFTNYSEPQIREMFRSAGVAGIANDAKPLIDAGIITDVKLSPRMSNLLLANAEKTAGNANNLTLTTAATGQDTYMQALNEAYMKVQSGAFSYQEALKQAIRQAAQSGGTVLYETGSRMSIDSALRMALLTGINQTAATLTEMYAEDMDVEYYEVGAHTGARPTHAEWQGRVYKIKGATAEYPNFYEVTGYGSGEGLCGWNCRHSFYPFWPGISKRAYTDDKLAAYLNIIYIYGGRTLTEYECSQIQRRYERQIRESKRILAGLDSGIQYASDAETEKSLREEFTKESVRLKKREQKMKDFCSQTNRKPDTKRTQVYAVKDENGNIVNYGRSTSMKAVWANRKAG